MKMILTAMLFILSASCGNHSSNAIKASDALRYVGYYKTVCGKVASGHYAPGSNGQPTFLNLGKAYPNHIFTIVIWGSNRGNFPAEPEIFYVKKDICVEGVIETYRGKAQIEGRHPNKIQLKSAF